MAAIQDVLLLDLDERDCVRPGTTLPEVSVDQLVDQPAELATGWSFLKHPDNHLDGWQDWLLDRVLKRPRSGRFIRGMDNTQQPEQTLWRDDAVARYMKGCENSADGVGYRGVFLEGGLVSFTTTYHKGYSFSKRVKTIHRYVPQEVSELVVYSRARSTVHRRSPDAAQRRCPPTRFPLGPEPEEQWEDDSDSEEIDDGDEYGEADREKAQSANPDGYWGTDRIRRVLREQTFQYMSAALGTRAWRHAYQPSTELAKDGQARDWLEVLYWNKAPAKSDARALQSGHSL
ncbi:hypothetical protein P3342_008273 [Pyrenophora teres f. teres]|nr:hypothetical protein P3342_008273 [Pyrenophora teres f. teres]